MITPGTCGSFPRYLLSTRTYKYMVYTYSCLSPRSYSVHTMWGIEVGNHFGTAISCRPSPCIYLSKTLSWVAVWTLSRIKRTISCFGIVHALWWLATFWEPWHTCHRYGVSHNGPIVLFATPITTSAINSRGSKKQNNLVCSVKDLKGKLIFDMEIAETSASATLRYSSTLGSSCLNLTSTSPEELCEVELFGLA